MRLWLWRLLLGLGKFRRGAIGPFAQSYAWATGAERREGLKTLPYEYEENLYATRSRIPAAPMPPPTHMVTMP